MSLKVSKLSNVNMEFNTITSHNEFLIHFLNWHHISTDHTVSHHDTLSSSHLLLYNSLLNHSCLNWSDHWLLYWDNNWLLNWSYNSLTTHKVDGFFLNCTKLVASFHENWLSHFSQNCSKFNSLLSAYQDMLINVLESKSTTLIEPNFKVSRVLNQSHIIFTVSINVESTSPTFFKSFVEGKNKRERPSLPKRVLSVDNNKSLSCKD